MDLEALAGEVFWWAMVFSAVALLASVLGVPWVVAQLPSDYFSRPERSAWRTRGHQPVVAAVLGVAKNLLGAVLVLMGLVMLVTPGQGVITLLMGLLLINFPGKYRLERWLVLRPGVLRALNWLRRRRDQPPFEAPR